MKLLRYGPKGQEKPGLLDSQGVIRDLSGHVGDIDGTAFDAATLDRLRTLDVTTLDIVSPDVRLGACVGNVGKFICIGLNYRDHAAESNMALPTEPIIFFKATSAIQGGNDDVIKPRGSTKMDWEVELVVVVGKPLLYADEAEAEAGIAGYCVCNDLSERAFQLERSGQWVKGKSCDSFGPIGPWLVTPDRRASCRERVSSPV